MGIPVGRPQAPFHRVIHSRGKGALRGPMNAAEGNAVRQLGNLARFCASDRIRAVNSVTWL